MSGRDVVIGIAAALLLLTIMVVVLSGGTACTPSTEIRRLAEFYLKHCINLYNKTWWTSSPAAVTSMLWDYRGIDTYYETSVFFLAIIGGVALFRVVEVKLGAGGREEKKELGLSLIVKTSTRIVFLLILIVAVSVALHGHVNPGGGFQAGSVLAVGPLLFMAAFSRRFLEDRLKLDRAKCVALLTIGLILIVLVIASPLVVGGALMQNQPKYWLPKSPWGYLTHVGPLELSGTLFFLDVAEFLVVSFGFTLLFIIVSIPEKEFRRLLGL